MALSFFQNVQKKPKLTEQNFVSAQTYQIPKVLWKKADVTQDLDPYTGLGEAIGLANQSTEFVPGQIHQSVDLSLGTFVILDTEMIRTTESLSVF